MAVFPLHWLMFPLHWLMFPLLAFRLLSEQQTAATATIQPTAATHPFYVSVTEINHNSKDRTLEISCKIFADDMEGVLKKNYQTAVDLSNEQQHVQNDKLINDYITRHLALTTDGKKVQMTYVGFEKEAESVYCYFEAGNTSVVKKIDIHNSILQDLTDQQINILHVTVGGQRKSYKLDYPNKLASFSF